MNYKYFTDPQTLESLKSQYRSLAFQHHPDRGGDTETMKAVNSEYDTLFTILKDVHQTKEGETFTAKQSTNETPEHFKAIISELMKMDNIVIEIIGCFVWVTGNTKPYKNELKSLKFQWHSKKIAWFLKPSDYKKQSRKDYDLEEIRTMYGTQGQQHSKGTDKIDDTTSA